MLLKAGFKNTVLVLSHQYVLQGFDYTIFITLQKMLTDTAYRDVCVRIRAVISLLLSDWSLEES